MTRHSTWPLLLAALAEATNADCAELLQAPCQGRPLSSWCMFSPACTGVQLPRMAGSLSKAKAGAAYLHALGQRLHRRLPRRINQSGLRALSRPCFGMPFPKKASR